MGGGEIFPVPGTGCDCPFDKNWVLQKDLKFQALGAVRHSGEGTRWRTSAEKILEVYTKAAAQCRAPIPAKSKSLQEKG